jgi:hypothetical protein
MQTGFNWLRIRFSGKHGNEPSSYMKSEEFLNQLNDYQFLKKDYSPWS